MMNVSFDNFKDIIYQSEGCWNFNFFDVLGWLIKTF